MRVSFNCSFLFIFDQKILDLVMKKMKDQMTEQLSEIKKINSDREAQKQVGGDQQNQQVCSKSIYIVADCMLLCTIFIINSCVTLEKICFDFTGIQCDIDNITRRRSIGLYKYGASIINPTFSCRPVNVSRRV